MANCQNNMRYMRRPVQSVNSRQTPPAQPERSRYGRTDGCPDTHDHFPEHMPPAMAYVPWQHWKEIYEPCRALENGTIFMELDKPFLGKGGVRR